MPSDQDQITPSPATLQAAAAVAIKLPSFYTSNAPYWFLHAEAQFRLAGITADQTKFDRCLSAIDQSVAARIMSTLLNLPEEGKYDALKTRLISEYTLSDTEKASIILDLPGLGDRSPSQLLEYIFSLLPKEYHHDGNILTKEIFLRQLPTDIRAQLTKESTLPLVKLAEQADKFFTNDGRRLTTLPGISAVAVEEDPPVAAAAAHRADGRCFYHQRWGEKAKKCKSPCSYRPKN